MVATRLAATEGQLRGHAPLLALLGLGLGLRLLLAFVVFPQAGLWSDIRLFADWSLMMADHGPVGFYGNVAFSDYPPGYLYVLWLLGVVAKVVAELTGTAAAQLIPLWIKLPAILADIAVAVVVYRALRRWQGPRAGLMGAGAYLLTPVTWYDSALWGQVDAYGVLAAALAIVWLIDRRPELATVAAVVAMLIKPQFAIVLPVVGVVLLRRHLRSRRTHATAVTSRSRLERWIERRLGHGRGRLLSSAVAGLATLLALVVPFDLERRAPADLAGIPVIGDLAGLAALLATTAGSYNVLTANAFNPWALVGPTPLSSAIGGDYRWTFDSLLVFGVPAFAVGAGLLAAAGLFVALLAWRRDDRLAILVAAVTLAVAFFVLPTRVHERYLFAGVGLGALLVTQSRGWSIWFGAASAVATVNMHAVLSLPFRGYGTPDMRALPFADLAREPIVVSATAILSIAVLAWPLLWAWRLWRGDRPGPALAGDAPARREATAAADEPPAPTPEPVTPAEPASRAPPDPQPEPAAEVRATDRGVGRRDLAAVVVLLLIALLLRLPGLERPLGRYFDESLHVGTATEFLQGWRYGQRQATSEWTHPHLAKYAIAAGIEIFGGHEVRRAWSYGATIRAAVIEPGRAGEHPSRTYLATAEGLVVAELGGPRRRTHIGGPIDLSALALDDERRRIWWGTSAGAVGHLGDGATFVQVALLDDGVAALWPVGQGRVLASDGTRIHLLGDGGLIASSDIAASAAVALPGSVPRVAVASAEGVHVLAIDGLAVTQTVAIGGSPLGLAVAEGTPFEKRARGLLATPALLVAAGSTLVRLDITEAGLAAPTAVVVPGEAVDVRWNPATNLVHALGREAGRPTIFVIEPRGMSFFADAELPFMPETWGLDVRRTDPTDSQLAVAIDADGFAATVAVGGTSFAARLPGVLLGAATVALIYALALVLFRRRSVALLAGGLALVEGLLFAQSRIATPDVYVGFFVLAALLALALVVRPDRPAGASPPRSATLLGAAIGLGVLLGLGAASKWIGLYAVGTTVLVLLLWRPAAARWLGVGLAALAALALSLLALSRPNPELVGPLVVGGAALALALIARRWPSGAGGAATSPLTTRQTLWAIPLVLFAAAATYVLSYVPLLYLDASMPQLIPGWPAGHTGPSVADLQAHMLAFHAGLEQPHGAGSPWWSWPLALKPLWGYLESFDGGQASILMVPNLVVVWLAIPAVIWAAVRMRARPQPVLLFLLLAFGGQWLVWAAIGRVAFQYHYYTALPFALLLLAALLSRLWHGASPRTWRWVRAGAVAALAVPAVMWALADPLCTSLNVDPAARACTTGWALVFPVAALLAAALVIGAGAAAAWLVAAWANGGPVSRRQAATAALLGIGPAVLLAAVVGLVGGMGAAVRLDSAPLIAALAAALALPLAVAVLRCRSQRSFVVGTLAAAATAFALFYPTAAAMILPADLVLTYQRLLPTWDTSFFFPMGAGVPLLALVLAAVLGGIAVATAYALGARARRSGDIAPGPRVAALQE